MAKALESLKNSKSSPDRKLYDQIERENLTLDKQNSQRPTIKVHQDRYLKPVKPAMNVQENISRELDKKLRILESKKKKLEKKAQKKQTVKKAATKKE